VIQPETAAMMKVSGESVRSIRSAAARNQPVRNGMRSADYHDLHGTGWIPFDVRAFFAMVLAAGPAPSRYREGLRPGAFRGGPTRPVMRMRISGTSSEFVRISTYSRRYSPFGALSARRVATTS